MKMEKNHIESTRESNYKTILWILNLKKESREKVKEYILEKGIKAFLLNHMYIELEIDEQEKIKVLKRVLEKFDGDIETINFGDTDEGC
jgi:hypothetical protein